MYKGQADSKIFIAVILITVLVIGAIFLEQSSRLSKNKADVSPTEVIVEEDLRENTILEEPIEEGISLELTDPHDGSTVTNSNVTVIGKTEANAEVFINEKETIADSSGNFSVSLLLEEGENIIVVTASDEEGNYAEKSLVVTYEPGETF